MELDYPWYATVEDATLEQGDFIPDCPVLIPPREIQLTQDGTTADIDFFTYNVVVMSQSCDLAHDKLDLVLLCPVWTLTEFRDRLPDLAGKKSLDHIRKGHVPAYHMLAACELAGFESEPRVVAFRDVYSAHINFLRAYAARAEPRLRLLPPYREHLSQSFARFFMRVGLPVDIPSFR